MQVYAILLQLVRGTLELLADRGGAARQRAEPQDRTGML
jgi:hypothetical protein